MSTQTKHLLFSEANAKTRLIAEFMKGIEKKNIFAFSLPAGHSCKFASQCKSQADRITGKITDGAQCQFRCFAASMEARSKAYRRIVWHNMDLLNLVSHSSLAMEKLILDSIPDSAKIIRVHVSGDFFSLPYFQAWRNVAKARPDVIFYGYTKAVTFIRWLNAVGCPDNFKFTISLGGTHDNLALDNGMKYAKVVYSLEEANALGLEIDHNEEHALLSNKSFALLIHGTQPAGSQASQAMKNLKAQNVEVGYHR